MKEIKPDILFKNNEVSGQEQKHIEPHNTDAEQLILGYLLSNNEAFSKIGDFLKAEHFFEPVHQKIYNTVTNFYNKGLIATPITLKGYFENEEQLQEFGGNKYLNDLAALSASPLNIKEYAKLIFDLYLKRKLKAIGNDVITEITDQTKLNPSTNIIEKTEQKLFTLASEGNLEGDFRRLNISLSGALETVQNSIDSNGFCGIPTNLIDLDKLLGGIQDSDLLILAGRPSMGKTALAINIALNACENFSKQEEKKSVGFFSLEMSSEQLASRMIAMKSGINAKKFRSGNFTKEDFELVIKANKALHNLNFFIDDTPALTISAIRTRARRLKRQNNLALLVIDYLQLVRGTNTDNRVQEISEITQGMKAIAKELNIPVIALSQLSRAVEQREDKRPQLADLRESGSIEQDSDVVMFIFREQYYIERLKPSEDNTAKFSEWQQRMSKVINKAEVMIAKQRHGPIGNIAIHFDPTTTKFDNLANEAI